MAKAKKSGSGNSVKMNEQTTLKIRKLLADGISQAVLAERFGVSASAVARVQGELDAPAQP